MLAKWAAAKLSASQDAAGQPRSALTAAQLEKFDKALEKAGAGSGVPGLLELIEHLSDPSG